MEGPNTIFTNAAEGPASEVLRWGTLDATSKLSFMSEILTTFLFPGFQICLALRHLNGLAGYELFYVVNVETYRIKPQYLIF